MLFCICYVGIDIISEAATALNWWSLRWKWWSSTGSSLAAASYSHSHRP